MKGKGLLIVIAVIAILAISLGGSYNKLAVLDENVDNAWAQVENVLKRRADLIPSLVSTVKGYADHEENVLLEITNARSGIENASTPQEFAEADAQLNSAIKSLNIVVEAYPELKANQNFLELQAELASTENKIATERMRYNDNVKEFNTTIRRFPTNLIAGTFNFDKRVYFEINQQDAEVPKIDF